MDSNQNKLLSSLISELQLIKSELRLQRNFLRESCLDDMIPTNDNQAIYEYFQDFENRIYHQLEAVTGLYATLGIKIPLPPMRGWAISPDFAVLLVQEFFHKKPDVIVELGSGISTLVSAYALTAIGKGKLISYEHDIEYKKITEDLIKNHGLCDLVEVRYAPINNIKLNDIMYRWYDIDKGELPPEIDILIVDGPPANISVKSRYPALPFFRDHLVKNSTIILDDGIRSDEKDICKLWVNMYPEFVKSYISIEKGAYILRHNQGL